MIVSANMLDKKKKVSNVTEKLVEHGIHCLPCSYINDVTDISS